MKFERLKKAIRAKYGAKIKSIRGTVVTFRCGCQFSLSDMRAALRVSG